MLGHQSLKGPLVVKVFGIRLNTNVTHIFKGKKELSTRTVIITTQEPISSIGISLESMQSH